MAVRLIRANSDIPNIQNYDDARILRFAVGGENGVIKDYKEECNYNTSEAIFNILPGEIVIDGWQVEIDGLGYGIALENSSSTLYYSVFAVVDLRVTSSQVARIESFYDTTLYDFDKPKEDLSNNPTGQHYLLLYTFKVVNGVVSEVEKKVNSIIYNKNTFEELNNTLIENKRELNDKITEIGSTYEKRVGYASSSDFAKKAETAENTSFSNSYTFTVATSGLTKLNPYGSGTYFIRIDYSNNNVSMQSYVLIQFMGIQVRQIIYVSSTLYITLDINADSTINWSVNNNASLKITRVMFKAIK